MTHLKSIFGMALSVLAFCTCDKDGGGSGNNGNGGTTETKTEFINPVYKTDFADPTVWKGDEDFWYAVCTQLHSLIRSKDLYTWEWKSANPLSESVKNKVKETYANFYAPDVTVVAGQRLMYVGLINTVSDSAIGVFKESSEPGHFDYVGTITDVAASGVKDCIDPDVVTDEQGRVWLFFGSTYGIYRVQLSEDGLSVKAGAIFERVAGKDGYSGSTRDDVFEAAYLYHKDGYWYLFASAGSYSNYKYHLVVGRSQSIDGTFVDQDGKSMVTGNATTILRSDENDYFFGPGHCGEIFTDTAGNDYMFYHCHNTSTLATSTSSYIPRPLMLQQIMWDMNGWPYFKNSKPIYRETAPVF